VDGLATWQPQDEDLYRERGKKTAREGYVQMSREYIKQREQPELQTPELQSQGA